MPPSRTPPPPAHNSRDSDPPRCQTLEGTSYLSLTRHGHCVEGERENAVKGHLIEFLWERQFSPVLKCNCVLCWLEAPLTNETYLSPFIIMSKTPQQFVKEALTNMLSLDRLLHKLPHSVIIPQVIKTIFKFLR